MSSDDQRPALRDLTSPRQPAFWRAWLGVISLAVSIGLAALILRM